MKRNRKPGKRNPFALSLLLLFFVLSIAAIQVQRIRYLDYLHDQGFSVFRLLVPVNVWLPFHLEPLSLILDGISILPLLFLALGGIRLINRRNDGRTNRGMERREAAPPKQTP